MGQKVGGRDGHSPAEAGVKQKGDECFSAGPDDEVGSVVKRMYGHIGGHENDQPCRQCPDLIRCIVDFRENEGD